MPRELRRTRVIPTLCPMCSQPLATMAALEQLQPVGTVTAQEPAINHACAVRPFDGDEMRAVQHREDQTLPELIDLERSARRTPVVPMLVVVA